MFTIRDDYSHPKKYRGKLYAVYVRREVLMSRAASVQDIDKLHAESVRSMSEAVHTDNRKTLYADYSHHKKYCDKL